MPLKRAELETQLERAKEHVDIRENQLKEKGITGDDCRKDAKWRHYNARCSTIRTRLNAVSVVEARDAEAEKRKTEKSAD